MKVTKINILIFVLLMIQTLQAKRPNIIFILADDLGYGDLSCYNPDSRIQTPHLDLMAAEGLRFTDAHSPATVCSPSRYGLLTGRMPFRKNLFKVSEGNLCTPSLINKDRFTIQEMLRENGYKTFCVGKWHLGTTYFDKSDGSELKGTSLKNVRRIDFTRNIPDGPVHRGFDMFYGTPCCPTSSRMYVFIKGDRVETPPDLDRIRDVNIYPKHAYSRNKDGYIAGGFDMEQADMVFLDKSKEFIKDHVKNNQDQPFFLYHAMQAVHLPSLAAPQFKGKSKAGPHGDFIHQMDFIVGDLLNCLEELNIDANTLVMFSSDNGPEVSTSKDMRKRYNHNGAAPWRGVKRDGWEGGHRVPMIARWPSVIEPGRVTRQPFNLTDVLATCAGILELDISMHEIEDSFDFSKLFLGEQGEIENIRPYLLHQAANTKKLILRVGDWKYIDYKGSGGNDYNSRKNELLKVQANEQQHESQLYNLMEDPKEQQNLVMQKLELVKQLRQQLEQAKIGKNAFKN